MLTINSAQVNFSGQSVDVETGFVYAYFDASYGEAQTFVGMTILKDDPQIMTDFIDFKNGVIKAKDTHGVVEFEEEVTEDEIDPEENL